MHIVRVGRIAGVLAAIAEALDPGGVAIDLAGTPIADASKTANHVFLQVQ